MFLEYGVDQHGELVHISQSPRGRVDLACPYCGVSLLARKGDQIAHHFAHDGETCNEASRDFERLNLPIWDRFHVHLPAKVWEQLQKYHTGQSHDAQWLISLELLKENNFGRKRTYELTHPGKIPFGEATLSAFADFQDGEVYARHNELADTVQKAAFGVPQYGYAEFRGVRAIDTSQIIGYKAAPNSDMERAALIDLSIYRAQVRRIYSQQLYLLLIEHAGGTFYKLGVTARPIDQRIEEIKHDLKPLVDVQHIEALRLMQNRGAVERYAHHRYRAHRAALGLLTEYYSIEDRRNLLSDFTRLGDRGLVEIPVLEADTYTRNSRRESELFSQIVLGLPSDVETFIQQTREKEELERQQAQRKAAHQQATRQGMMAAKEAGKHVGRPPSSDSNQLLARYQHVVEALNSELSLRMAAKQTGVAVNTVRKVKVAIEDSRAAMPAPVITPTTKPTQPVKTIRNPKVKRPEYPPLTRADLEPFKHKPLQALFDFCAAEYEKRHGRKWIYAGGKLVKRSDGSYWVYISGTPPLGYSEDFHMGGNRRYMEGTLLDDVNRIYEWRGQGRQKQRHTVGQ